MPRLRIKFRNRWFDKKYWTIVKYPDPWAVLYLHAGPIMIVVSK